VSIKDVDLSLCQNADVGQWCACQINETSRYAGTLGMGAFIELFAELPATFWDAIQWLQGRPLHAELLQNMLQIMDCPMEASTPCPVNRTL